MTRELSERTLNKVVGVYNRYGRQAGITAMAAALVTARRKVWEEAEQLYEQHQYPSDPDHADHRPFAAKCRQQADEDKKRLQDMKEGHQP